MVYILSSSSSSLIWYSFCLAMLIRLLRFWFRGEVGFVLGLYQQESVGMGWVGWIVGEYSYCQEMYCVETCWGIIGGWQRLFWEFVFGLGSVCRGWGCGCPRPVLKVGFVKENCGACWQPGCSGIQFWLGKEEVIYCLSPALIKQKQSSAPCPPCPALFPQIVLLLGLALWPCKNWASLVLSIWFSSSRWRMYWPSCSFRTISVLREDFRWVFSWAGLPSLQKISPKLGLEASSLMSSLEPGSPCWQCTGRSVMPLLARESCRYPLYPSITALIQNSPDPQNSKLMVIIIGYTSEWYSKSYAQDKVTSFLSGLKGSINIDVILDRKPDQKYFKVRTGNGEKVKLPIYTANDDISGEVKVELKDTKKYEHLGVKCTLVGYLEIFSDKNLSTQFHSLSKQLQPAGILTQNKTFKFKFPNFQKQYETFNGIAGRVRYFIRVTVNRNMKTTITKQIDFAVLHYNSDVEQTEKETQMKMEVGIEDCLHIQFQFNKHFYHLKDVILGRVLFHLVKLKIKFMEINLVRKETFGTGNATSKIETENLVKYEVMDGCPAQGETVPIRMYMNGVQLTPSYKNIHNRLSVKYSINLVLVDEEDRRYFKQTEIIMYRKPV